MNVHIRREGDSFLAYFLDSRRLIEVNRLGASILDSLFNKGLTAEQVADQISEEFGIARENSLDDAKEFLAEVRNELVPDGFTLIQQEQMEAPLGVELEITEACNLSCRHCFQPSHPNVFMRLDDAKRIIGILAKSGVFEISLIGGEPFRHPDIFPIIRFCEDVAKMAVNVVTNATLLDEQVIRSLSEMRRTVLIVSLDGTEELHDAIRGQGVFKKVDGVLRLLRKMDVPVEVTCTLNSLNVKHYRDTLAYTHDLEIPCNFNLFKPFRKEQEWLTPAPVDVFRAVEDLLKLRVYEGYQVGLSNAAIVAELLEMDPRNECRATRSGLVVNVEGRLVPCPSLKAAGYYDKVELPHISEDYISAWKHHECFEGFRANGLRECQARALIFNGNVKAVDPYGISSFQRYRLEEARSS